MPYTRMHIFYYPSPTNAQVWNRVSEILTTPLFCLFIFIFVYPTLGCISSTILSLQMRTSGLTYLRSLLESVRMSHYIVFFWYLYYTMTLILYNPAPMNAPVWPHLSAQLALECRNFSLYFYFLVPILHYDAYPLLSCP